MSCTSVESESPFDMEDPTDPALHRALDCIGDKWGVLLLREALEGKTRFEEFRRNLKIAPNILSRRLADLVDRGLLERRRYLERPPRDEYILTEPGRNFASVLVALRAWSRG